jgi:hypothetical protein
MKNFFKKVLWWAVGILFLCAWLFITNYLDRQKADDYRQDVMNSHPKRVVSEGDEVLICKGACCAYHASRDCRMLKYCESVIEVIPYEETDVRGTEKCPYCCAP